MLQTIIIADSRHVVAQSFKVEAGFATFHRFLQSTIPKYIAICDSHDWISRPLALVVLTDKCETPTIINGRHLDLNIASKTMESAEYQLAGAACKLAAETWGTFLVVAVRKLGEMLSMMSSTNKPQMTAETKARIVIYSTDVLLAGVDNGDSNTQKQFKSNAELFCTEVLSIRSKFPNINVEIVCASVNEIPSTSQNILEGRNSDIIRSLQVILEKNLTGFVSFTVLGNSSMNFEEELRRLVAANAPVVCTTLEFPPVNGAKCSIKFELSAITVGAADSLRPEDWISLSMFSIASRADIDPLFLEGGGLVVRPAGRDIAFKTYASGCQQYWAIIPPESGIDQFSHATTLTYGGGRSVGAGANEILRGLETNDASHMVAVRLTDRDGVLQPPNSAYGDQRSLSAFSMETTSEQDIEADKETLKETSLYLEEALFGTMGIATQYNPLACPSGTLNKKVSELLFAIKTTSNASHGSNTYVGQQIAAGGWNSNKTGVPPQEAVLHVNRMLPQQTFLQQRQQQPPELLQRHQPIAQEKYQKHRHSSLPYVNLEDSRNNRQYPQVQEYKVKPLEVVAATRPNNRIGGPGGKVNSSMGGVAGAGVVTGTDVQSKSSSSSSGHTMVRTARADFSDGPQNVSNRHVNSRSIQHDNSNRYSVTNGSSNYDSVTINQGSGSNQSDGNDVQILGSKLPFKRGNVEISEGAGMQSNSYKPTSAERNKRPKMSDSKLKQAPKVETKKMFQKRAKAWNIVNDEDDYQSEQEVNAKNGQNNLKYDDIDDSDTEDVFEL